MTCPADAYHIVADHLTDDWWLLPPSPDGVRLTVTARTDQRPSTWHFDPWVAEHLTAVLHDDPRVRSVGSALYSG